MPKIPIEVDGLGDVTSQLNSLAAAAQKLRGELGKGVDVPLKVDTALSNLKALNQAMESLKKGLAAVGQTPVDVDVDRLTSGMEDAQKAVAETQKALGAIGGEKVHADISEFKKQMTEVAKAAQQAFGHGTSKGPSLAGVAADSKTIKANLEAARKATADWLGGKLGRQVTSFEADRFHQAFQRRAQRDPMARGFADVSAWDTGAGSRFSSQADADRYRRSMLDRLSGSSGIGLPGHQEGHGGEHGHSRMERFIHGSKHVAGGLGAAAGGALAGGGSGGMGEEVGSLAGIGVGMGAGALIGGPVGAIVGAGVGALANSVLSKLGANLDESFAEAMKKGVEVSDIRRAMGEQATNYEDLNKAIVGSAHKMGLASDEATKLAKAYARDANLFGESGAKGLGSDLHGQFGFANAFGMSFGASTGFFGAMRGSGVTQDEKGNRSLAIAIADAMGRGAMFARSEEMLNTLRGFVSQAQSGAFRAPDVERVASMIGTGVGLQAPGLDPAAAGRVLAGADASFRGGGSAGEAGQTVIASALMQQHGIGFFREQELQSGGMFGTPAQAFGDKSILMQQAQAHVLAAKDDPAERARWEAEVREMQGLASGPSANKGNAAIVTEFMKGQFRDPQQYKEAMGKLYGQTPDQAAALDLMTIKDPSMNGLKKRLTEAGVKTDTMDMGAVANMAQIVYGGEAGQQRSIAQLEAGKETRPLSKEERDSLNEAKAQGGSVLTDKLLQLFETRGRSETPADEALAVQKDIKSKMIEYASTMIPLTTHMKEAMFALVEKMAPDSPFTKQLHEERARLDDIEHPEAIEEMLKGMRPDDPQRASVERDLDKARAKAAASRAALGKIKDPLTDEAARIREADKEAAAKFTGPPAATEQMEAATAAAGPRASRPSLMGMAGGRSGRASDEVEAMIRTQAERTGVDPALLRAVIQQESGFNAHAVSNQGAMGLGQLMPETAKALGVTDPFDAAQNVRGTADLLASLKQKYPGDTTSQLMEYHAGPNRRGWGPKTNAYPDQVMRHYDPSLTQPAPLPTFEAEREPMRMPESAPPAQGVPGPNGKLDVNVTAVVKDSFGRPSSAVELAIGPPAYRPLPAGS